MAIFFFTSLIFIFSYFIGAIPTGALLAFWLKGIDITRHGSGNIGASNVARVMGKRFFIPVSLIDILKSYFTLWIASILSKDHFLLPIHLISIALLIGNTFSPFLGLRGGKGVATAVGIILYLAPVSALIFICAWITIVYLSKKPFFASFGSIIFTIIISNIYKIEQHFFLYYLIVWFMFTHRENMINYLHQKIKP